MNHRENAREAACAIVGARQLRGFTDRRPDGSQSVTGAIFRWHPWGALGAKPSDIRTSDRAPLVPLQLSDPNDVVAQVIDRWYAHWPPARSAREPIRTVKAR